MCGLVLKYITNEFTLNASHTLLDSMTATAIEKYMQSGFRYHVAEMDGQLAGVVGVRNNAHLFHLFVAELYQRQGIASRLWNVAMQACLEEGNPGEFTVNSSRYALSVYEKLGFITHSGPQEKNGIIFFPMKLVSS